MSKTSSVLQDLTSDVEIPASYREALARVKKTSLTHRKPRDKFGQYVNNGIKTGPQLTKLKLEIMSQLADRCGKEVAESFSSIFCTTGLVPDPTGSMGRLEIEGDPPLIVQQAFCMIEALAWKVYQLDPVFHNFPTNAHSSVTFPYYVRDEKGVVIKKGYAATYQEHGERIRDELGSMDLKALHSAKYHLPMFFSGTTGLRIQTRAMKEVHWQGNTVVKTVIKPNRVTNWKGEEVWANMDVPGDDLNHSGKGRGVAAQSTSTNQLLGEATAPVREAMYQKGIWHSHDWIESWGVSWNAAVAIGWDSKLIEGRSSDFSRMDGHMQRPCMTALLNGIRRAGWNEAFINLKQSIEFSPMICPCDSKSAPPADAFARMLGAEEEDSLRQYDAGHHSGSAATDVDNGILGTGIMTVIQMYAGNITCEGYSRTTQPGQALVLIFKAWIDAHWDDYFEGLPTAGNHSFTVGNKGDDHVTLCDSPAAVKRYEEAMRACAPYFDIQLEAKTTFLGCLFVSGGTGFASEAKFYDNNVNPETPITERPYYPIGIPARIEHYRSNPLVTEHLLPILEQSTAKIYGNTWTRLAQMAQPPAAPPQPINAAELNFLYDPSVLMYKYTHEGDIREELVLATGAYFYVPAEDIEYVYNLFRR